jgi:transposase
MNEALRHEIVQRQQQGQALRAIARDLGIARKTVARVCRQVQAQRAGQAPSPPSGRKRPSQLDAFGPLLQELLVRYPNITGRRLFEELHHRGFAGSYSLVRDRLRQLRPRPRPGPVVRFETGPGAQAQMDYGVYDLDFLREGRRRVYLFSYVLSFSRRGYLHFVEAMDQPTTLREHVHAFHHLGGLARVCLYDNFKAVILRHDADGPVYHPKFLAFATHYGFKPWACKPRRPQTKGKVERKFFYVETSLLNGRTFDSLEHLNEVTAGWLTNVADVRLLRDFQETPQQRHARELAHLLPLPAADFDTALVVYRQVNAEGYISQHLNFYSVPWSYIGQVLPVRVTDHQVIIYSTGLDEIARHPLLSRAVTGQHQQIKSHHPSDDPDQRALLLRQRFEELGPVAVQFLDGLLAKHMQGKRQAQQVLALLAHYQREDVLAALERAVRFGAFSLAALRRILAAQARPKPFPEEIADFHPDDLDPRLRQDPIGPRPASDYQQLLPPEDIDETLSEEQPPGQPNADGDRPEPA